MSTSPKSRDPNAAEVDRLADLVNEAWPDSPVPKSLLKRIDQQLEEAWGPSVARSRNVPRPTRHFLPKNLRGARPWILAAVAATVCLALFPFRGSSGYSWAAMLERLREGKLLEATEEGPAGSVRWLSLNEQIVGLQGS